MKSSILFKYFTAILATIVIAMTLSLILSNLGVPSIVTMIMGFTLGFTLPNRITAFILSEEEKEYIKSVSNVDQE